MSMTIETNVNPMMGWSISDITAIFAVCEARRIYHSEWCSSNETEALASIHQGIRYPGDNEASAVCPRDTADLVLHCAPVGHQDFECPHRDRLATTSC